MKATPETSLRVASLDELKHKRCIVIRGEDRPIAVFYHEGKVHAVDNRCPHLGFPLSRGTVEDGILTCHWHHARFDLTSGCTFDLFADDVPSCAVEIREGAVWVNPRCRYADESAHWTNRLREGMEMNISLVVAKAIYGMMRSGSDRREIVRRAAQFGTRNRDTWPPGMTILIAMANLAPYLPEEETYLALYQGVTRVANDCAGQPPRRDRQPLASAELDPATLQRWLRYWTLVRQRDAAERTLLTAIEQGQSDSELAAMMFPAATDRYYADGGHTLDFINKAFECLDLIGWDNAPEVLPSVVRPLVSARGGEESNSWRRPIDLVPLLEGAFKELPSLMKEGGNGSPIDWVALAGEILGDDPTAIVNGLKEAIRRGARATDLTKSLAYAAALRIARFGTANEFPDWITALHTFTYCHALHQAMKRITNHQSPITNHELLRGVFHGAMSVYLDRFLNVPPARLPGEADSLDDEPTDAGELRAKFLSVLDTQQRVDEAGRVVARYLERGHPIEPLIATLTRAVVREDADFHTFQMLEAGVKQHEEWRGTEQGKHILIAVARFLAAHSPTQRAQLQTAVIAQRLHRGDTLYEE